jgi:hypothetical protein
MIQIILIFLVYSLLGTLICDKIGVLYDTDDFLESLSDGVLIAFWPLTVLIHFLLDVEK